MFTKVKTEEEIKNIRESGQMLAKVLGVLVNSVAANMSTKDLANIAKNELKVLGGKPAFLGYAGFPDVICISVNDEVVHGIPRTDNIIKNGDIVSLDFGVTYKGMITDAARTVVVGKSSDKKVLDLVAVTEASLDAGIQSLREGVCVGDIGNAVESVIRCSKGKYGIVRDLVGHGVGHELHEDPNIPNYGKPGTGPKLMAGMTIAIEPMITLGTHRIITDKDGWTIRTRDGSLAAHFEDTVLITKTGAEILTR